MYSGILRLYNFCTNTKAEFLTTNYVERLNPEVFHYWKRVFQPKCKLENILLDFFSFN